MRDLGTLTATSITYEWLISVGPHRWSVTSDRLLSGEIYRADIRTGSWSGMEIPAIDPASGTLPPQTCSLAVMDPDRTVDVADLIGAILTVKLVINDAVKATWAMRVKSATYLYGEVSIACEDYWQQFFDKSYPNTPLLSSIEGAGNVQHAGGESDTACVPVAFGDAYVALRSVWVNAYNARVFPLGMATGWTYTVAEVSTPIELEGTGKYPATSYTMQQVNISGAQCLIPHIANGPGNTGPGFFRQGEQLLDMPVKYTATHEHSGTLADVFVLILTNLGCPIEMIDMDKIAITSAQVSEWATNQYGQTYGYAYTRVRTCREVISELLVCSNTTIKRTDKIWIEPINSVSVIAIDRERVTNSQGDEIGRLSKSLSYSPAVNDATYYGGVVGYWPTRQVGDMNTLDIYNDGPSWGKPIDSSVLRVPFYHDIEYHADGRYDAMLIARISYRRKYWKTGTVIIPGAFDLAGLEPWDAITVDDPGIYGDALMYCVVSSVSIGADMSVAVQADVYHTPVGDITDYHIIGLAGLPDEATTGAMPAYHPTDIPVCTTSVPTQWDGQLTVDGRTVLFWYGGNLWARRRLSGVISSQQIT